MKYGIILWGNSSSSGKNFALQKKIVRIMAFVHEYLIEVLLLAETHVKCPFLRDFNRHWND
jgi:hypothetical protein